MCGLAAALRCDPTAFKKAVQLISHRGVRTTTMDAGTASIAHARLPIVGLGEEHDQPIDRAQWITAFVGQLLDFREICPGMECDAELAADTWVSGGPEGFRRHDGFWSIAAIDRPMQTLHLLVDYLSQKPLYFRSDAHAIGAASEPDAAAAMGPVTPDVVYFSAVVKWGYCPETWRTPYAEVRRMLPGEHVVLTAEAGAVHSEFVDVLRPAPLSPSDLKREIEAAVRRRVLSSDVAVAALVSGGLDSAIAYTLAKRHGDVVALHVENGERSEALEIAPDLMFLRDPYTTPDKALAYMQEPIDLGSLMPQTILSDAIGAIQLAKYPAGAARDYDAAAPAEMQTQKIHVCLTGDGADELFGGYSRSARYDSQASDVWHELVAWHLPRLDRVMMRNRVEVRSPFLARRVAAAALALPWADRRGDKQVLRRLFRDDLPRGAAERPKRPLRLSDVENDREAWSRRLVDMFREKTWPRT